MMRQQAIHAIRLIDTLMQYPDAIYTKTELCRLMGLRRSPYALEILNRLILDGVLVAAGFTHMRGLRTSLLTYPADAQGEALLLIDDLWQEIRSADEESYNRDYNA